MVFLKCHLNDYYYTKDYKEDCNDIVTRITHDTSSLDLRSI